MADKKFSALTELVSGEVATDDALAIVDTSATETKKITADELSKAMMRLRQQSFIDGITVSASSGSLPAADGSVTIADAATPTVVELLEYCRELEAKVETLLTALIATQIIAAS